uniref:DIVARICATA-like MYB transcription factor n=1 Tax=Torenia fournieri TaxID=68875 RepID=A0A146ID31_9LAMI|nr:DIVARICATA-like MYB transcription factor [Torenia fournieri]
MMMNTEIGRAASYPNISSNWSFQESKSTAKWTHEENKRFENALALFDKDTPDRWDKVASMIPGKTVSDVIKQYRELVEDVSDIEAGLIPLPGYGANNNSFTWELIDGYGCEGLKQLYDGGVAHKRGASSARSSCSDHERKKGVPWTEEEHRQFLLGLKKYGKGDWRNIARNFVTTRTPTQVASHAQKYFIRQLSGGGKDKRRSSIHDITTVNLDEEEDSTKSTSPERKNTLHQRSNSITGKMDLSIQDFGRNKSSLEHKSSSQLPVLMGFCPLINSDLVMLSSHLQQGTSSIDGFQGVGDPRGLFKLGHHDTKHILPRHV